MKKVTIGGRPVGDGFPCLISLEAGATHTGLESAKQLATIAAEGGADAIKFQTVDTEELLPLPEFHYGLVKERTVSKERAAALRSLMRQYRPLGSAK